jgi:AcrR family transcriptional regulator
MSITSDIQYTPIMVSTRTAATKSRPRDAQATKEILLAAASSEFAEHGLAGARIDRIAERAGANKRLLYRYFGDKSDLFNAVMERHVALLTASVTLTPDDLGAFAGAEFDFMLKNPETLRIATWRSFESIEPTEAEQRSYKLKVDAVDRAQREGKLYDGVAAIDLFAITVRMVASWLSAPPALAMMAGKDPFAVARLRQHRKALVEAVRRVTEPR